MAPKLEARAPNALATPMLLETAPAWHAPPTPLRQVMAPGVLPCLATTTQAGRSSPAAPAGCALNQAPSRSARPLAQWSAAGRAPIGREAPAQPARRAHTAWGATRSALRAQLAPLQQTRARPCAPHALGARPLARDSAAVWPPRRRLANIFRLSRSVRSHVQQASFAQAGPPSHSPAEHAPPASICRPAAPPHPG